MVEQAGGVQAVFRAANERLRERFEALTFEGRRPVICECADPGCMQVLDVPDEEYERARAENLFIVAPGHGETLAETG
jgi:hypothetical protein